MSESKIILCGFGSRRGIQHWPAMAALDTGVAQLGLGFDDIDVVIQGGAEGVDAMVEHWAIERQLNVEERKAKWREWWVEGAVVRSGPHGKYNLIAGLWRNEEMAQEATHFIGLRVKHRKSTGTDDMRKRVEKLGKPLYFVEV